MTRPGGHPAPDVIVLGLGGVGSQALLALARSGANAVGLERHGRGHAMGSSHGGTRITRHAYFEHPDYVPLLRHATAAFQALQANSGVPLLHRCGVLLVGRPDSQVLAGSAQAAERHGVPVEALDAAQLTARFPALRADPGFRGLFEPGAGFLRPEAAVAAAIDQAQELGAEVHDDVTVLGWEETGVGVRVWSAEREWHASALVIAAGAWTPVLAPALAPLLTVTRQIQAWVQLQAEPGPLPCWLVDRPGQAHLYGLPPDPLLGDGRAKVALHGGDQRTTADGLDRTVQSAELQALRQQLDDWVPGLKGPVASASVCMYTSTKDAHFIVDRVPQTTRCWVAAGLSGHGFKLTPALGQALADLALHGHTELPVAFLSLDRIQ